MLLLFALRNTAIALAVVHGQLTYPSRRCVQYTSKYKSGTGINSCGQGDRITGASFATRSPAVGIHGMAASSHPLVTTLAIDILKKGGSAVDAAIAANAMQGLVEPMSNGIGGDIFAIVHNPKDNKLYGYNGSGRSSMNFTFDEMNTASYNITGKHFIPVHGPLSITIPGAVQGWCDLHEKFGKLPWSTLFDEAIDRANNGFVVTQIIGDYFQTTFQAIHNNNMTDIIREITSNGKYPNVISDGYDVIYTQNLSNGTLISPKFGSIFKNTALASTYKKIAIGGCDEFYRGSIAQTMVDYLQSVGSHLTYEDFAHHTGEWIDVVNVTYRDYWLISELPPNAQGIAALQMLNMMELYPFGNGSNRTSTDKTDFSLNSANYLHANIEIKKLVFADRAKYYADEDYEDICIPVTQLISKEYAEKRNALISMNTSLTASEVVPGELNCTKSNDNCQQFTDIPYEGDTIYITVADADGMMVSWIQSNYNGFGSLMVSKELGFGFQDRGALFSLQSQMNNRYNVGKRPFQTIIPAFLHRKKNMTDVNSEWIPFMSFGVMGGNMQPQGHVQIISNMVDFGLNVQEVGDVARWQHSGSQQPTGENITSVDGSAGEVIIESGICETVANELIERGHAVRYGANGGGYQGIVRDPITGVYFGGSEFRKDGIALGY